MAVFLRVLIAVGLASIAVSGISALATSSRRKAIARDLEGKKSDNFIVSFTGIQIYILLVWGCVMLVFALFFLGWALVFPQLVVFGSKSTGPLVPAGVIILIVSVAIFVMLWVRLGTSLMVSSQGFVLVRRHRTYKLDLQALQSAEYVHGKGRASGVEGLKLNFALPGKKKVTSITLWEVVTHYGLLRMWLQKNNYLPEDVLI